MSEVESVEPVATLGEPAAAPAPKAAKPAKSEAVEAPKAKSAAPAAPKVFPGKDVLAKGLAVLKEANPYAKPNLEAVKASVDAAAQGAKVVGAEVLSFSKESFDKNLAAAKSLTSVRSLGDVLELQTNFATSSLQAYLAQTKKVSGLVSASLKDAVAPLSGRYAAVVERFQA